MSKYTTILKRGVLCVAVILFAAFFTTQVQAAFGNTPTGTPLVGGVFNSNFTVKNHLGKDVTITNRSFTVLRGLPLTISWDAKGEEAGSGGVPSSTGVRCINDWGTDTNPVGNDSGILTSGRTFMMSCIGLGSGIITRRTANVGTVNLIISDDISFSGLSSAPNNKFTIGTYTLSATIKNAGTMPVNIPFKVSYVRAPSQDLLNSTVPLAVKIVEAVSAPNASMSVAPYSQLIGSGEVWFKVCADTENTVPETIETDNCKILGPINVVAASN